MIRLYVALFLIFSSSVLLGQKQEIEFYSYLQFIVSNDLNSTDSIVIDQYSEVKETLNWQAVLKNKGDSCIVIFLPPQYSQDTMLASELKAINRYTVLKKELIEVLEWEKELLKNDKNKVKTSVEVSIVYDSKAKRYQLKYLQRFSDIVRYEHSVLNYKIE